jgi:hypothetical protein
MAVTASAQRVHHGGKVMHTRTQHKYNVIKMPRSKAKTICPIFEDTGYPYQAIGIKLGDPFALTYKYYPNKHLAFVADFGRSASGLYSRYYSGLFDEVISDPDDTLDYFSHKVKADWVGELKILYHINAENISPGLQVYAGLGWELRSLKIQYDFIAQTTPDEQKFFDSTFNRFTQGIEGVLGIEYSYFKLPISAFMELEYYVDVMKDPGWRKVQGGVGLRYVF